MNNNIIDMPEQTPLLESKRCKLISLLIRIFLQFSIYFTTIIMWYIYDYFVAFFTLVFSFILIGIIRSKLRNSAIPFKQREYQYNDKEISDWYVKKRFCSISHTDISLL